MDRMIRLAGALAVVGVLALMPAPSIAAAPSGTIPDPGDSSGGRVIVVAGQGEVEAAPDRATIRLGIQTIRPTAQDAQEQSSAVMERVLRQITALGIPRERIKSAIVALLPQRGKNNEITGYEAVNQVTVTVDDLALTGRVIDAGVTAGANTVAGLSFGLRDPSASKAQALRIAVQNAQATASAIAAAAGAGPIHLVRVTETGAAPVPRLEVAAPMATATPVLPGTVSIAAEVRAVYSF